MLLLLARKTRILRCLHAVTVKEHACVQASPIFVLLSCQIIFLSFWLTFFPLARSQGHFDLGNVHAPRVSDREMLELGSRFVLILERVSWRTLLVWCCGSFLYLGVRSCR